MTFRPISRRTMLGATLAAALLPAWARGQQGTDPASQEATDMKARFSFMARR